MDVAGELDLTVSPQLARMLREAGARSTLVVLDLRALAFMDSAGAHVIIDASLDARLEQRALIVVRGPTQVDS
ncbi:MAG: STAS domain-containing protein, partial [Solirubrobacteraceae bacterium]